MLACAQGPAGVNREVKACEGSRRSLVWAVTSAATAAQGVLGVGRPSQHRVVVPPTLGGVRARMYLAALRKLSEGRSSFAFLFPVFG